MDSKQLKRSIFISILVACMSFQQFTRLNGIDNIRPIHIITLLTCGAGIGVFIVNVVLLIKNRKGKD